MLAIDSFEFSRYFHQNRFDSKSKLKFEVLMQISSVAVIGAGTMGASITVALVSHGYSVLLKESSDELVAKGLQNIEKIQSKRVAKGLERKKADEELKLISTTTEFSGFSDVDMVIEAVPENIDIKRSVFEDLDEYCNVNAILASNTSSLSISQIASFTRRPDKVVGLHFFNPAHLMKLVEVIPGLETSDDTVETSMEFARSLGKLAVRVDECASFLVNRLLGRYMNESLFCLQEGIASIEEIDKVAVDYVVPVGPLALRDMNGADIGLAVAKFNYKEYGERFSPPLLLERMVEKGLLGRKSGKGFYLYDPETKRRTEPNPEVEEIAREIHKLAAGKGQRSSSEFRAERMFLPMINEAFLALQENVCAAEDLDPALMAGLGMRKGPIALAVEIGLADCLSMMEEAYRNYGERFRPAPLLKRFVWAKRSTIF